MATEWVKLLQGIALALIICLGIYHSFEMRNGKECRWISFWCYWLISAIYIISTYLE